MWEANKEKVTVQGLCGQAQCGTSGPKNADTMTCGARWITNCEVACQLEKGHAGEHYSKVWVNGGEAEISWWTAEGVSYERPVDDSAM
jgi:hypothetical protein